MRIMFHIDFIIITLVSLENLLNYMIQVVFNFFTFNFFFNYDKKWAKCLLIRYRSYVSLTGIDAIDNYLST